MMVNGLAIPAWSNPIDQIRDVPQREIRLSRQGALLACTEPRYSDLGSYIAQFAAPLSTLRGAGIWSFADPIEGLTLIVETAPRDWCGRCDQDLADCSCAF